MMQTTQFNPGQVMQELEQMRANAAMAAMEAETRQKLEDEIFHTVTTSPYPRMELAKIARWNNVGFDHIEQVAQRVIFARTGKDLESIEFQQICKTIAHLEKTIKDPGLRSYKLQRLAKRFNTTARQLMEAYNKSVTQAAVTRALSVKEFRELNGQDVEWLVPGWIPKGTTLLLHADGGVGKTLFGYGLIESVVQGKLWNGYPVEKSPVLLVQVDEPALVTAERIDIRGFQDDDPLFILSSWGVDRMEDLERYIDEIGAEFIIIDSLTAINTTSIFSENDTEYARPLLQLADIASRKKKTFLIIHHSNADGNSRGTRAIHNSVSEVWGLTMGEGCERVLRVQKTRMGRPPGRYKFLFSEDDYSFTYLGEENADSDTSTQEGKIRLWLMDTEQQGKPFAPVEVSEILGIGKDATRRALRELWAKGLIRRKRSARSNGYVYFSGQLAEGTIERSERSENDRKAPIAPKPSDSASFGENDRTIGDFSENLSVQKQNLERSSDRSRCDGDISTLEGDRTERSEPAIAPIVPIAPIVLEGRTASTALAENPLQVGDKVEILSGQFAGKPVYVVQLLRKGRVKVKGQEWAIAHSHDRSNLRLIQRRDQIDG